MDNTTRKWTTTDLPLFVAGLAIIFGWATPAEAIQILDMFF